jgi:hypothetical protein
MDERRRAIRQERFLHGRVARGRKPANCRIHNIAHEARGSSRPAPPYSPDFEPVVPHRQRLGLARDDLLGKSITALTESSRGNDGDRCRSQIGRREPRKFQGVPGRGGAFIGAKS